MSIDPSRLPPARYIPGRQYAIDHAGRIDKQPFVISTGILFGMAILSVLTRFSIRIFGGRKIRWDDGLVLLSSICLIIGFAVCHRLLNTFYLIEAMNKRVATPFREDIPRILDVSKWAFIFAIFNWTSVYLIKFTFMYFFHILTVGLSTRVTRFYWTTLGIIIVCWVYTVINFPIICPYFGAEAAKCSARPDQHDRSVAGNVIVAVMDIVSDILIVSIPIIVVRKSMMSFSRKLSIAAMLCLSIAMIICAFIRLAGSLTETTKTGSGTAPVWATYWSVVEACISLTMASVIVIRGVFITNLVHDDRAKQNSMLQRFGQRILSTLRLSGSSRSSRRSPQRTADRTQESQPSEPDAPRIGTQKLPQGTMNTVRSFIRGGRRHSQTQDLLSVDTAYVLEDMDYHNIRRAEATKPNKPSTSTRSE